MSYIQRRRCGAGQPRNPVAFRTSGWRLEPPKLAGPATRGGRVRSRDLTPLLIGVVCLAIVAVLPACGQNPSEPAAGAPSTAGTATTARPASDAIPSQLRAKHPTVNTGGDVNAIAFSPDGRQLVSGGQARNLILWDVSSGREIRRYSGHPAPIEGIAFSPDGLRIISGDERGGIRLWDVADGTATVFPQAERRSTDGEVFVLQTASAFDFSADGKHVLACGRSLYRKPGIDSTTGYDHQVWIWDLDDLPQPKVLSSGTTALGTSARFLQGAQEIVSADQNSQVYLWDVKTGRPKQNISCVAPIYQVAVAPDESGAILATAEGLQVWNWNEQSRPYDGDRHAKKWCRALSRDKKIAVSGVYKNDSKTESFEVWDLASGRTLCVLDGQDRMLLDVEISPDSSLVAAAYAGGDIRVWKLPAK